MFRILSIDGGGVRGVFPAYVLKQLSNTLNGQSLRDLFDLVIGTSTGGIIAAAIAQDIPSSALSTSTNRKRRRSLGEGTHSTGAASFEAVIQRSR
jgi:uncharacterized protein